MDFDGTGKYDRRDMQFHGGDSGNNSDWSIYRSHACYNAQNQYFVRRIFVLYSKSCLCFDLSLHFEMKGKEPICSVFLWKVG